MDVPGLSRPPDSTTNGPEREPLPITAPLARTVKPLLNEWAPLLTTRALPQPTLPTVRSTVLLHDEPAPVSTTRLLLLLAKASPISPRRLATCAPSLTSRRLSCPPLPTVSGPGMVQLDPGPAITASLLAETDCRPMLPGPWAARAAPLLTTKRLSEPEAPTNMPPASSHCEPAPAIVALLELAPESEPSVAIPKLVNTAPVVMSD